jgi:hypothetical protein
VRGARTALLTATVTVVLAAALWVAWTWWPDTAAGPCVVVSGPSMIPELTESSGLAVSRRTPGLIWSHNDSGNAAVLYGLDATGTVRGRVRVPIRTRDWEDISAARCPAGDCLFIADIGDNDRRRRQVQVYRVAEPAPDDAETARPDVFNAAYADGPHNAEAMFVVENEAFIITRDRTGGVYRATIAPAAGGELTFRQIAALGLAAVTDAETSRDGTSVVVRTSHEAVWYRTADLTRGVPTPYFRIPIDGLREPQGEGIALDGNLLYLSSEGRPWRRSGSLIGLRCELPR